MAALWDAGVRFVFGARQVFPRRGIDLIGLIGWLVVSRIKAFLYREFIPKIQTRITVHFFWRTLNQHLSSDYCWSVSKPEFMKPVKSCGSTLVCWPGWRSSINRWYWLIHDHSLRPRWGGAAADYQSVAVAPSQLLIIGLAWRTMLL